MCSLSRGRPSPRAVRQVRRTADTWQVRAWREDGAHLVEAVDRHAGGGPPRSRRDCVASAVTRSRRHLGVISARSRRDLGPISHRCARRRRRPLRSRSAASTSTLRRICRTCCCMSGCQTKRCAEWHRIIVRSGLPSDDCSRASLPRVTSHVPHRACAAPRSRWWSAARGRRTARTSCATSARWR